MEKAITSLVASGYAGRAGDPTGAEAAQAIIAGSVKKQAACEAALKAYAGGVRFAATI